MTSANPFPDYPVARLRDGARDDLTVRTVGIARAEELIDRYLDLSHGVNVPVRGAFGAGKTHLLSYAMDLLRRRSEDAPPGIISVSALEATPIDWYRAALGAQIGGLDLPSLVDQLFADGAASVARNVPLSAGAGDEIDASPALARALVAHRLLSSTAVELAYIDRLDEILVGLDPVVDTAVRALSTVPAPATRWLTGEPLSESEQARTGLTAHLDTDRQCADVIVAAARLYRGASRPFLLVIDELEHFTRADHAAGESKRRITWLKRLLEELRSSGALVFVAGHDEAWAGKPDYLDRFTTDAAIDLEPFDARAVAEVVTRFAGSVGALSPTDLERISELADGNIRRVFALLRVLYDGNPGFAAALSAGEVERARGNLGQRLEPEMALDLMTTAMADARLDVTRNGVVNNIPFDLVGYDGDALVVVVELKFAAYGRKQQQQAQGFIDKLRVVRGHAPECYGAFVAEGDLDRALLDIDPSAARIAWLDLAGADFIASFREALREALASTTRDGRGARSRADRALDQVADAISDSQAKQAMAYDELDDRLSGPGPGPSSSLEFRAPPEEEWSDRRRVLYSELAQAPPLIRRVGLVLDLRGLLALMLVAIGVILVFIAGAVADALTYYRDERAVVHLVLSVVGLLVGLIGLVGLGRRLLAVDRFYEFKSGRLRDAYVMDLPLESLLEVNDVLATALDRYGPVYARRAASVELDERRLAPGSWANKGVMP
jgi:hypothetical protein